MKPVEPQNYGFVSIEINWVGPSTWKREKKLPDWLPEISSQQGWYRAEQSGRQRSIIKYIGSNSGTFLGRFRGKHRIKTELLPAARETRLFFGLPKTKKRLTGLNFVEIEYIMQNIHWVDLISWHGLTNLPKISRGMAWQITNTGKRGALYRHMHSPAFLVADRLRKIQ